LHRVIEVRIVAVERDREFRVAGQRKAGIAAIGDLTRMRAI
jgi:hypothetical protein